MLRDNSVGGAGDELKTLGQVVTLVLWLGAWLALIVGAVMLIPGTAMLLSDPQAAPTCDERTMEPGTICRHYRNGAPAGGETYEQALAAQRNSHENGIQILLIAGGAIIASSAVLLGIKYALESGDQKPATADPRERELLRAATAGDPVAMNNLARLFHRRVEEQNRLQRWLRRHQNGGDLAEAQLWFRRAAVAGHPDAMAGLAALLNKDGNHSEAELWYRRATAAEAGPYTRQSGTAAAAPAPPRPRPNLTQPGEFKTLLTMVMGNHPTAERLIAFEQQKTPGIDRAAAITKAIERLRGDLGR
ncbi:hypothetical protein [Nocardia sp. N2S4-5]|uniref:hypothetical protein n=1 Tax=Nocardia sp. N2S4-5 TaxID=3351565 RepID=UPI0037D7041E